MASRKLDDLDSRFRPKAMELIARCVEAGIALMIVNTLRTQAEQEDNVKRGVSWTKHSRHLPQPPEGKSLAIDVAPYAIYQLHSSDKLQWDANDPAWSVIGAIGGVLGLKWGVIKDGKNVDLGHFEFIETAVVAAPMDGSTWRIGG